MTAGKKPDKYDCADRAQISALGDHFNKLERGEIKPFDKEEFEKRPKISRMGFTPEELESLRPGKNR